MVDPQNPATADALELVVAERQRQDAKWGPAQRRGYSVARWLAVLAEEVGELAGEVGLRGASEDWYKMQEYLRRAEEHARIALEESDPDRVEAFEGLREELIQVAAVAVAALEALDAQESAGPPPTAPLGSPA